MSSPVPPPLPAELDALLRRMRLPHMRRTAPEVLATARAQRWDPAEVLKLLLNEEVAGRERSALATRRVEAAFPTGKTFATWDASLSSIPAPTQTALRTLEWIGRRENLVVCGPSGTGKTFFLEALGQTAVEAGLKVAWFSLEELGVLVRRHRADDSHARDRSPRSQPERNSRSRPVQSSEPDSGVARPDSDGDGKRPRQVRGPSTRIHGRDRSACPG
jgi:DNA replication protein DnaC